MKCSTVSMSPYKDFWLHNKFTVTRCPCQINMGHMLHIVANSKWTAFIQHFTLTFSHTLMAAG